MRALKAAAVAILMSWLTTSLGSPVTHAAVLSVGPLGVCGGAQFPGDTAGQIMCLSNNNNSLYGGFACADVQNASLTPDTPIQAYDCHAGPNQQFELVGFTIYALGGQTCVAASSIVAGSPVVSTTCAPKPQQTWYYYNGQVISLAVPLGSAVGEELCLDAGNANNGSQLVINTCNGSPGQNWQFK